RLHRSLRIRGRHVREVLDLERSDVCVEEPVTQAAAALLQPDRRQDGDTSRGGHQRGVAQPSARRYRALDRADLLPESLFELRQRIIWRPLPRGGPQGEDLVAFASTF